jgi:hypothetical protein
MGAVSIRPGQKYCGGGKHKKRFDTGYFPMTGREHLELLQVTGFKMA